MENVNVVANDVVANEQSLSPVISSLETIFKRLNETVYNNELELPTITVLNSPKSLGHCSVGRRWQGEKGSYYEVNISAEYLSRPFAQICETMLHEMCHLYAGLNDIRDCSGYYHNKSYKKIAESHGLNVERTSYGWNKTSLNDHGIEIVKQLEDELKQEQFTISRMVNLKISRKGNNFLRYVCPCCGAIIRSTTPVNVICADCNVAFERNERFREAS